MITGFQGAIRAGEIDSYDVSDEDIAEFASDLLRQVSLLIEFTGIPHEPKTKLKHAIEEIEASIVAGK
jgi:hypothetical protein